MAAAILDGVGEPEDICNFRAHIVNDVIISLCKIFSERLQHCNCKSLKIYWPRKKHKRCYDLCVNLRPVCPSHVNISQLQEISDTLVKTSHQWKLPLEECTVVEQPQLQMCLRLNRTILAKLLLTSIHRNDGFINKTRKNARVSIYLPSFNDDCTNESHNLTAWRTLAISEMLSKLLEASGFVVEMAHFFNTDGEHYAIQHKPCSETLSAFRSKLISSLQISEFLINEESHQPEESKLDTSSTKRNQKQVSQDTSSAISDKKHCNILTEALYDHISKCNESVYNPNSFKNSQRIEILFIIVPHHRQHCIQTLEMAWKRFTSSTNGPRLLYLTHSPVRWRDGWTADVPSANHLFRMEFDAMKRSYFHKYGNVKTGQMFENDDLNKMFADLAGMNVKFQLLSCSLKTPVTVTCGEDVSGKGGTFIMYNYARICALLSNFQQFVQQQQFPPLPPVSETDFSLFQKEEEWNLVVLCTKYTQIIDEVEFDLLNSSSTHVCPSFHKIIGFLNDLTSELSIYYSHVHVLREPALHLRCSMYARIWLLTYIKEIYESAFILLNITPVKVM